MNKEIAGLDTIQGLTTKPPKIIDIPFQIVKSGDELRRTWNINFIAFIPYCIKCKEPLVWHSPPGEDNILFHCPKCKTKWVKDKKWVTNKQERTDTE